MDKSSIQKKYIEFMLENGSKPKSVFAFAKILKLNESEFYSYYSSFEAIEKDFWKNLFSESVSQLATDETYKSYDAKDKLLAFYYVWIQKLRENRSFVVNMKCSKTDSIAPNSAFLDTFKKEMNDYVSGILTDGMMSGTVKDRKFLSERYHYAIWFQTIFILNYWLKDSSENFEMTDAAIEKSVNLIFKLLGENTFDIMLDFGKFLFQKTG